MRALSLVAAALVRPTATAILIRRCRRARLVALHLAHWRCRGLRLALGLLLKLRLRHCPWRLALYRWRPLGLGLAKLLRFAINVAPLFVLNGCRLLNFAHCRRRLTIAFFSCGGGGHCRLRAIIVGAWWAGHWPAALTIIGIG